MITDKSTQMLLMTFTNTQNHALFRQTESDENAYYYLHTYQELKNVHNSKRDLLKLQAEREHSREALVKLHMYVCYESTNDERVNNFIGNMVSVLHKHHDASKSETDIYKDSNELQHENKQVSFAEAFNTSLGKDQGKKYTELKELKKQYQKLKNDTAFLIEEYLDEFKKIGYVFYSGEDPKVIALKQQFKNNICGIKNENRESLFTKIMKLYDVQEKYHRLKLFDEHLVSNTGKFHKIIQSSEKFELDKSAFYESLINILGQRRNHQGFHDYFMNAYGSRSNRYTSQQNTLERTNRTRKPNPSTARQGQGQIEKQQTNTKEDQSTKEGEAQNQTLEEGLNEDQALSEDVMEEEAISEETSLKNELEYGGDGSSATKNAGLKSLFSALSFFTQMMNTNINDAEQEEQFEDSKENLQKNEKLDTEKFCKIHNAYYSIVEEPETMRLIG